MSLVRIVHKYAIGDRVRHPQRGWGAVYLVEGMLHKEGELHIRYGIEFDDGTHSHGFSENILQSADWDALYEKGLAIR